MYVLNLLSTSDGFSEVDLIDAETQFELVEVSILGEVLPVENDSRCFCTLFFGDVDFDLQRVIVLHLLILLLALTRPTY